MPITRRAAGVVDQNSAVYHDAADTNPQTDVSILWTTADEVLKLQREARNHEPVARFHSWRTELINSRGQALVKPSTARVLRLLKPFHKRPRHKLLNTCRLLNRGATHTRSCGREGSVGRNCRHFHLDHLILGEMQRKTGGSGGDLVVTICDAVENGERPAAVRAAH